MRSADRIIREVSRMRRGPLAPASEAFDDNRLPETSKDDLKHVARTFAVSHTVDELMFLAGALEAEAQKKLTKSTKSGAR